MTLMMKQRFQALLYIVAILAAIQITGCRSNSMSGGGGATGGILPPSSVAAQITTAAEAGSTSLTAETPVVHVTWSNPVYDAAEFTIQLEYKKSTESTYTSVEVDNATSHIISGIDETVDYNVRLKATTEDGEVSDYVLANALANGGGGGGDTTCPVAQGLAAAVISPTQVQLSWTWSSSNYSELDTYLVQRKLTSTNANAWLDVEEIVVSGTPSITYMDSAAIPGEIHYRIVSDCDQTTFNSVSSNAVTALTALPIPLITSVLDYGNYHRVNFNFTADGLNGHTGFQIEYVVNSNAPLYATLVTYVSAIYQNVTPIGCSANQLVTYRIRATRANLLHSSQWSQQYQQFCP